MPAIAEPGFGLRHMFQPRVSFDPTSQPEAGLLN
jgi:hypothetical protein